MGKLVSVVVPVYNVEKYLKKCVNSILCQTYKNIEIILVDDGSTDNCPKICDEFKIKDNRVVVIHKKNGGLSDARNFGINEASGSFITFVDSDDFIMPDMIEYLYNICEEYNSDFSVCQSVRCDETGSIKCLCSDIEKENIIVFEGKNKMDAYLKTNCIHTTTWSKLYDIKLFNDIRFPKGKIHEDAFTTYILVNNAGKIVVTSKTGYVYRVNPTGIMNSKFSNKNLDAILAKKKQLRFIIKNYPKLSRYAYAELIYSCNYCLSKMAVSNFYEPDIENNIQSMYRKYIRYYLISENISIKGKLMSIVACVNTSLARKFYRLLSRFDAV